MKTYFRLLSFARPIGKYAIPYTIFTLLAVLFSTLNLALLAPLLSVLFDDNTKVVTKPEHFLDVIKTLNYYAYVMKTQGNAIQALKFVCGVILASVILGNVFRYLSERTMENLRINTLLNLRRTVFNNVMDLHLGYFSNERKGDIISKIASDVQVVQFSVTGTLQVIFKEPLTLLFFLGTLIAISPTLTLFSILVVPVGGLIIARIVKNLKKQAMESHQTFGMMISYLDESLNGMRIVKAFNASRHMKQHFDSENHRYSNIMRGMARRQQLASPVSESLGVAMVAGIVLYGGTQVLTGHSSLTASSFVAYIAIFSQLMRPAKAISTSFSNIHSGIAAGERVLALIDERPQIVDAPDAKPIHTFEKEIRFDNVSFAYADNEVLHNVNVSIPKGNTVALVGPSGGGKSTMMDLIPRFIVPSKGRVLIDGHDLETLQTDSVRELMGVVNQESILFNDTIFNNIAFARPNATLAEVEAAARVANAHNFIMDTEAGYQTNIGDKGSKLSGGQRQRICIARAVLRNPPIMLLDEATSALDTESEKLVQDALNNLMKNRTSLIIAHRLSTIQTADLIIVLEHGQVVEQGTHQQLVNQNGLYRKLIDMQTFAAS